MKLARTISGIVGGILILGGVVLAIVWSSFRIYVKPGEMVVLIRKTGDPLPDGQKIAEPGQQGIQRDTLGPGRHFRNPLFWDWEKHPLVKIAAGDPSTWQVIWPKDDPYAVPRFEGEWPKVGIVTRLTGKAWTGESEVVDEGYQGIQRKVLTPGVYRLNPYIYKVEPIDAAVVPLGCVGVVTSQLGEMPGVEVVKETSIGPDGKPVEGQPKVVQKLAEEGQRGVLQNILPPGIYYLNPYVHKVKLVQIGYNQISALKTEDVRENIIFPAADGFTIEVEVTVVWGRHPEYAPEMINRFGDVAKLKEIILSQIRSICRNIGSEYESTDFIRGEKRALYQQAVTETLQRVAKERDIEILIALIQNIEVKGGTEVTGEEMDLKGTIQRGYIAQEQELTRQKQREPAEKRAELETAQVQIEIAREQVSAETRKKTAEILAEGQKKAEEIDAQRDLEVARIERQIAQLEAEQTRVLGRANARVEELANQAEADGKRLLIDAFGSGRAYNLYTFAENFDPESIRLIFAGEGTFWTDLSRLQDAAALELLKSSGNEKQRPAP